MSYLKTTTISGYNTAEKNPYSVTTLGRAPVGDEVDACLAWQDKHYESSTMDGHWSAEKAAEFASKRGWHNVSMTHSTSDMSGKGRGSQTEYKFEADGSATAVSSQAINDSADVHDAADEVEPAQ